MKPLLEAMDKFESKDWAKRADLLQDIRSDVIEIGESHTQRDIFEQLLFVVASKSV